ncbi:TPA: hypothetical protein ACF2DS_001266 [Clostridium perfringens]|uniref:hypothetical protein n=1 Tax=Clostridium perfringens TaxID=1502 RepID=UPI0018AAAAA8|nr:hypothetical protein [Clostridium perfringens]EHR1327347.1 hypothetical protein [Clostridium perfringens]EHR1330480.1 hypothetical protein [Clostridium perfringens]EHR1423957.1 hypothetical protein [Clostridium perfringens]EIF6166334.1 hypothetical protein [Clostridium perfringens]MBI5985934.1 hypothetical protein [Clostridium perfringens]
MKELLLYIGLISVGLIIGNYLPSYTKEKGKNLATKEDIKEITKKTEEVKQEFNEKFGEFSKKLDFKYRFYEEQMINLYSNLYAMIAQSEYLRYFIREYRNKNVSFDEAPFWEVKKGKQHQKTDLFSGKVLSNEVNNIEDDVTRVRKIEIANEIIKNSKYAENRLLKLAVAYRYINKNYSNGDTSHLEEKRKYDIEEIKLLGAMLKLIIKKYNFLARELGLSYSEYELKNGIFKEDEFDVSDLYTFKEE